MSNSERLARPSDTAEWPASRRRVLASMVALVASAALVVSLVPDLVAMSSAGAQETDFNGDGRDDIFWYAPGGGRSYVWSGQANGGFSSQPRTINGRYQPLTGDFNGSGRTDIFWYRPGTSYLWVGQANGGFSSRPFAIGGTYTPFVGDFNGSGRDDVFWYRPGAMSYVWYGQSNGGFSSRGHTISGVYEPVTGDFNGNGRTDIFWYRPGGSSVWYGQSGHGFASKAFAIGGTYTPVVGDFNGDGRDGIFWYRPGTSYVWHGRANNTFSSRSFPINGTYQPFVGDFNGDSRADVFFYRPGMSYAWFGRSDGGFTSTPHAIGGTYQPITGDYNGDGRTDIFWYRRGTSYVWHGQSNGTFSSRSFPINGTYQLFGGEASSVLRPVAPGQRGPAVEQLQRRLRDLNFFIPRIDGNYDGITQQAVMAFQKYHGLGRDGVAGSQTIGVMQNAAPARAMRSGDHIEISIARQTMIVVRHGRTIVFNTSTGRPGADTPRGTYRIFRQINGMRYAPLGQLWRPKYFNGGIALHGSQHIPGYPASAGCTRLHNEAMNYIWDANLAPIGTTVVVS